MARTVVVLCDVHLEQGRRVKAEELPPVAIEDKGPRVLALCAACRRDYYDPFKQLVEDLAQELPEQDAPLSGPGDEQEGESGDEQEGESGDETEQQEPEEDEPQREDPERVIAESPAMQVVPDEPDTARWDCPMDDCDKSYSASGENRAEDLKRLGNLHLSTGHHLDKAARQELLSA
ncbi:hypothetical protein [Nocardioides mesophilus]|uniref:Uncharacterized protein n=1 Tax=Nocardioides mesophilus TaxID=433659 RepID=A0A7G9RCK4_9ACTN|nr:hypothetical protein [Nocardioides mesophilus]QNN53329.1 hypothetical protein H9L09_02320 [Nocardioides mesophilus]